MPFDLRLSLSEFLQPPELLFRVVEFDVRVGVHRDGNVAVPHRVLQVFVRDCTAAKAYGGPVRLAVKQTKLKVRQIRQIT